MGMACPLIMLGVKGGESLWVELGPEAIQKGESVGCSRFASPRLRNAGVWFRHVTENNP